MWNLDFVFPHAPSFISIGKKKDSSVIYLATPFLFFKIFLSLHVLQVRSSDVTWSDTRRSLRKDHRWESASLLEREEKEKIFSEHIEALTKKKREHFRQLLDETSAVSTTGAPLLIDKKLRRTW